MVALEILLAVLQNIKCVAAFFALGSLTLLTIGFVISMTEREGAWDEAEKERWDKRKAKILKLFWIPIFLSPFALVPDLDELWKVRIGLLKLQLASYENIEKTSEEIGRIAKKLECKYLGDCEGKN